MSSNLTTYFMDSANTFASMKPNFKESYAGEKPKKFQKTRKALQGIGLSIHLADKNPQKYMQDQSMDIKKYKGTVA